MEKILTEINKMRSMMGLTVIEEVNVDGRTGMSEFLGEETDSVDTLLKMMSKYTPKDGWLVSFGYINNTRIPVKIVPSDDLEQTGKGFKDEYIDTIINKWKSSEKGSLDHPHAERTKSGVKIPSTIYKMKTYTCQWLSDEGRNKMKSQKDADIMAAYKNSGQEPPEIAANDPRGSGWESIQGTPFSKHANTGTQRLVVYRKSNCYTDSPSRYFINIDGKIQELSKEKANFYFKMSQTDNSTKMPVRLAKIEDEELRDKLWSIEQLYDFKNMDLEKVTFLNCTCVIDGKNVKLTYLNKNAAPDGVDKGQFKEFIKPD